MKSICALLVVACAGTAIAGPVGQGKSMYNSAQLSQNRSTLWDQSFTNFVGIVDQDFPDFPTYSTVGVDDFSTGGQSWNVDTVVTYYSYGFGIWPGSATAQLSLYKKTGSAPSGADHMGNLGSVPVTIYNLGSALAVVADTSGVGALQGINGDYWIGLTPTLAFGTYFQEFHLISADPTIGNGASYRNEGGSFGIGTDWVDGPGMFAGYPGADHCFTLGGDVVPAPSAAALLALGGVFAGRRRR
ncbi:MAG: PEP-CTERM sorting domain-containing protein [Phycisphaerales bacterium]